MNRRASDGLRVLRIFAAVLALGSALGTTGCARRDGVDVRLESRLPTAGTDPRRLRIQAQVTGPLQGLHYKWFSVVGECDPQESTEASTTFRFAEGGARDRVSVEVWRDGRRIAQNELDVQLDEHLRRLAAKPQPTVEIAITEVPPYQPYGGTDTRATIAGKVSGELTPDDEVLVYARADGSWFIQPLSNAVHQIKTDRTWTTWTHTGSSYAALVVRPGAYTYSRLDVIPPVGGDVLARAVVAGTRR